jgi:hypothetical protein
MVPGMMGFGRKRRGGGRICRDRDLEALREEEASGGYYFAPVGEV